MNFKIKTALAAIAALGLIAGGFSVPAQAAGEAIHLVNTNDTLSGSTITGFDPAATLRLAVFVTGGTVTWNDNGSGATLVNQNNYQTPGLLIQGTQDQLTAALSGISYARPCAGVYKIYAEVSSNGFIKNPENGHLYKHSDTAAAFQDAMTIAAATPLASGGTNTFGYVATITSPTENAIVGNILNSSDWAGASDAAVEGDWVWMQGPEAGTVFYRGRGDQDGAPVNGAYQSWNSNEPNDWGSGEDLAEIYGNGMWNDITDSSRTYTIEWGGMPGDDLTSVSIPSDSLDITVASPLSGGGTKNNPLLVSNLAGLESVSACQDENIYFKQTADITLPNNWAGDQNFKGQYDGDGHTITYAPGLLVGRDTFGIWANAYSGKSSISNLKVSGDIVSTSYGQVGLLVGYNDAKITDVEVSGSITTSDGRYATGGVFGSGGGKLTRVKSTVNFTSTSDGNTTGGIAGEFWGSMSDSSWNGTINISGTGSSQNIGGLIGASDCATVTTSTATGTITVGNNGTSIGGLLGYLCGEISNSKADVDITALTSDRVGGAIGYHQGNVFRTAAYGDVSANSAVGGLFGWSSWSTAEDIYARGQVTSTGTGGSLIGKLEGSQIQRAYATGTVSAVTSRGLYGELVAENLNATHWVPAQAGVTEPNPLSNGEVPYSAADSKSFDYYAADWGSVSALWTDSATWTICSRAEDGYPILTALYAEDPCSLPQTLTPTPVIIGSGEVGSQLTGNPGSWDSGVTLTFSWYLDGTVIAGETGNTYTPVEGDIGKTVTFSVRSTKADYRPVSKTSVGKVIIAKPLIVLPDMTKRTSAIFIGGFAGNSWWTPLGFYASVKKAVKAHTKATALTCVGVVAPGGWKPWQKTLGLKRAELACATAKMLNPKLKTTLSWRVATSADAKPRAVTLTFNK